MANKLNIAHINIRSLIPKFNLFKKYVVDNQLDIVGISETWLNSNILNESVEINGYKIVRKDRQYGRGGGVILYIKNYIKFAEIIDINDNTAEQVWVKFKYNKIKNVVGVLYRTPPVSEILNFCSEFEENICNLLTDCDNFVCVGDFNINVMNLDCNYVEHFLSVLGTYNLKQLINEPTRHGLSDPTLLDIIICSNEGYIASSGVDHTLNVSDHCLVRCGLDLRVSKFKPFFRTYRDFKNFDRELFNADLSNVPFYRIYRMHDIHEKLDFFNDLIISIFNVHAPIRTARITKKRTPWITQNLKYIMSLRNKALSKYKKHRTNQNWESYRQLRNYVTLAIGREKKAFLQDRIRRNGSRDNWKLLKELNIYGKNEPSVPDELGTVDEINDYFVNIPQVDPDPETLDFYLNNRHESVMGFDFRLATVEEIKTALFSIKSRAVGVDGISIDMLLYCCPLIVPVITHLVNCCIETHIIPGNWKMSHVIPIQKVNSPSEFKDRPCPKS